MEPSNGNDAILSTALSGQDSRTLVFNVGGAHQTLQEDLKTINKEHKDVYNRLHSIAEDAEFVSRVAARYPSLPVIGLFCVQDANELVFKGICRICLKFSLISIPILLLCISPLVQQTCDVALGMSTQSIPGRIVRFISSPLMVTMANGSFLYGDPIFTWFP